MKIIVKCETCGNECEVSVLSHKYVQIDDYLKRDKFLIEPDDKEILIQCQRCKDWIKLGIN